MTGKKRKKVFYTLLFAPVFVLCAGIGIPGSGGSSDCSESSISTRADWTNDASCKFDKIAKNYEKLAGGLEVKYNGTIPMANVEEQDSATKSQIESDSSDSSAPEDTNLPYSDAIALSGSAARGGFAKLQPFFQERLIKAARMYKSKYGKKMRIQSAYRSPAYQAKLFQNALNKYGSYGKARHHVAPPGRSRHNVGLAADINMAGIQGNQLASAGILNACGLWRPMGWENWHVEPVETKATRKGGSKLLVADANLTQNIGYGIQAAEHSLGSLGQRFTVLSLKSRYSQEFTLMTAEQIVARNRLLHKKEDEENAQLLLGGKKMLKNFKIKDMKEE